MNTFPWQSLFHFRTRFFSGVAPVGPALRGFEIPCNFRQPLIVLLSPWWDQARLEISFRSLVDGKHLGRSFHLA